MPQKQQWLMTCPQEILRSVSDIVVLIRYYLEKWKKGEVHEDTFRAIPQKHKRWS